MASLSVGSGSSSSKCPEAPSVRKVGAVLMSYRSKDKAAEHVEHYRNHCTAFRVKLGTESSGGIISGESISKETDDSEYIITAAHCFQKNIWQKRNGEHYYPRTQFFKGRRFVFCEQWIHSSKTYTKDEVEDGDCVPITEYWTPHLWPAKNYIDRSAHSKERPYSPDDRWDMTRKLIRSYDYALAKVTTKKDGYEVMRLPDEHIGASLDKFMSAATCSIFGYPGTKTVHHFDVALKKETSYLVLSEDIKVFGACIGKELPGGASGAPVVCHLKEYHGGQPYVVAIFVAGHKRDKTLNLLNVLSSSKVHMMREAVLGGESDMIRYTLPVEDASSAANVHMFDGNSLYEMELVSISLLIMIIGCLFCVLCWLIGLLCGYISHAFCSKQERVCKTFDPESVCMI